MSRNEPLQNPGMTRFGAIRRLARQKNPFVFNGRMFGLPNFRKLIFGEYIVDTTYPKM